MNRRCMPAAFIFIFYFLLVPPASALDRSNVPLKNWGGFSISRSWTYDALEKIVLAGLAEQVLLNTKPLSRTEAARIVAQAVRRIESDQFGDYRELGHIEDLLYRLVEEFGSELIEMGVSTPLNRHLTPKTFTFTPVDHVQFGVGLSDERQTIINQFGQRLNKGINGLSTLDGRMQFGDYLSFYYQPAFSWDRSDHHASMLSGYGKATLWNTELEIGRDSLWWGPGFRGSMLISNNAPPIDQIRLSNAEPFYLPWHLKWLGPVKAVVWAGYLDDHRDIDGAKVGGMRVSIAPFSFAEVGFGRLFMFGGRGREIDVGQFLQILFFNQGSDTSSNPRNVNNLLSVDATFRFSNVGRYIGIARDAAIYGELGWDDTTHGYFNPDRPGTIIGVYLTGVFGDPKLDLRLEWARTSIRSFTHDTIYFDGFTYRGRVVSHFIGTEGRDIYARLTRAVTSDLTIGLQASSSKIGSTAYPATLTLPRENRTGLGVDLSYRISEKSSVLLGYDVAKVKNRNFVSGKSGTDYAFRIEFTHAFGRG